MRKKKSKNENSKKFNYFDMTIIYILSRMKLNHIKKHYKLEFIVTLLMHTLKKLKHTNMIQHQHSMVNIIVNIYIYNFIDIKRYEKILNVFSCYFFISFFFYFFIRSCRNAINCPTKRFI